jgi:hypothetical protein
LNARLKELWLDFGVYLVCMGGVSFFDMLEMLRTPDSKPLPLPTWRYWVASAVLAIGALIVAESSGETAGKRARWKRRAVTAFLIGVSSTKLWEELL